MFLFLSLTEEHTVFRTIKKQGDLLTIGHVLISPIPPLTQKSSYILTKNGGSVLNEQLNELSNLIDEWRREEGMERDRGE